MSEIQLTPDQELFIKELQRIAAEYQNKVVEPTEYRAYYDEAGKIITYATNHNNVTGNFVVITQEQYNLARHDATVKNDKLILINSNSQVYKLARGPEGQYRVNKQDMTVLVDDDEEDFDTYSVEEFQVE